MAKGNQWVVDTVKESLEELCERVTVDFSIGATMTLYRWKIEADGAEWVLDSVEYYDDEVFIYLCHRDGYQDAKVILHRESNIIENITITENTGVESYVGP